MSISRSELIKLSGGEVVGGNVTAVVNGERVWLAKETEGVFALTEAGLQFVADAAAKSAAKPRTKSPKRGDAPPVEEGVEGDDAGDGDGGE